MDDDGNDNDGKDNDGMANDNQFSTAPANEGKLERALSWALAIAPDEAKRIAEAKRTAFPGLSPKELAQKILDSYRRKGAMEGFVSGLPSNPIAAGGAALFDVACVLRFYGAMSATMGYLANPRYFEDPDWHSDALLVLAGPKVVSRTLEKVVVQGGKQASKMLIKRYARGHALRMLKRWALKWLGRKVTQRAIITKTIPVIGGAIGGTWNYVEIGMIGKRIIQYHFEDELA